jgi:hypothetical protein
VSGSADLLLGTGSTDRSVQFATDASVVWDESEDEFYLNKSLKVNGGVETDGVKIRVKQVDLPAWDMSSSSLAYVSIGVSNTAIAGVSVKIFTDNVSDAPDPATPRDLFEGGHWYAIQLPEGLRISRDAGGVFDSGSYSGTVSKRGVVTVWYRG